MIGVHPFRRFKFATLFFGLFMLAAMAGCVKFVQTTTTCPSCCEGKTTDEPPPPGACNPVNFTGVPINWWDDYTGAAYTGNTACNPGAKKCGPIAGRCANGTACKSRVNSNTMNCKCDCVP